MLPSLSDLDFEMLKETDTKGRLQKKKGTNLGHCPKFGYPLPPSELGTSLCEIFLTGFLRLVNVPLCLIQRDLLLKAILIKIELLSQVVS